VVQLSYGTGKGKAPAWPAWENSSLGFNEAVYQWL